MREFVRLFIKSLKYHWDKGYDMGNDLALRIFHRKEWSRNQRLSKLKPYFSIIHTDLVTALTNFCLKEKEKHD